jgi:hypothetical protein
MHTQNSGDLMVLYTDLEGPIIRKPSRLSEADKDDRVEQLLWKESVHASIMQYQRRLGKTQTTTTIFEPNPQRFPDTWRR